MNRSLERIDPASIPHRTLYTNAKIPAVGLGTFGSDRYTADEIADAVVGAGCNRISAFRLCSRVR